MGYFKLAGNGVVKVYIVNNMVAIIFPISHTPISKMLPSDKCCLFDEIKYRVGGGEMLIIHIEGGGKRGCE